MKYLFNEWHKLRRSLKNKRLFLFLDYDGTLIPIVDEPKKAVITKNIQNLIKALSRICDIAIISGRSLKDIKKMVGVKNIIYAGNHGLEMEGPNTIFQFPLNPIFKKQLHNLKDKLLMKLSSIHGVLIEDKGLTLSIHYRLVNKKRTILLKRILNEIIEQYKNLKIIKVTLGKKVFEIKPSVNWNKGKCVQWLLKNIKKINHKENVFPVYIGDDVTDEDAFRALKNKGLTIFVGTNKRSSANYYLRDTNEVLQYLKKLKTLF